MRISRSQAKLLSAEFPVGNPFGGPAYGERRDIIGDLFGGGESAPAPQVQQVDPVVGQSMMKMADTGDRVAREAEARQAKYDPILTKLYEQQAKVGEDNAARSGAQWDSYKKDFLPIEQKLATTALNYDTPEKREAAAAAAAADVESQAGLGSARYGREAGRLGIGERPGSEGFKARLQSDINNLALGKAGAMNNARKNVEMTGLSLVDNAAKFGRNMTSTGIAADQLALAGAGGAGGTIFNANNMALNNGNAGLPALSAAANTGIGMANANNNATLGAFNAQTNRQMADASAGAGFGQLLGTLGGAAIQRFGFGSSKEIKEDKEPINDSMSLAAVRKLPVEKWKYKDGVEDSGEHIGPYAEDVAEEVGEHAAPGGKVIDPISMMGLSLSAIKALDKKVEKLSKSISLGSGRRKVQTRYAMGAA